MISNHNQSVFGLIFYFKVISLNVIYPQLRSLINVMVLIFRGTLFWLVPVPNEMRQKIPIQELAAAQHVV